MNGKNKIEKNDIIISVIIPIVLCLVVPLILYWVNSRLLLLSQKYSYDFKLIVFKRIIYILIYIAIFIFFSLRDSKRFKNYLIGFLLCIASIILLFIINPQIFLDDVNEFIIGGTLFSYFLVGLSMKVGKSYKKLN